MALATQSGGFLTLLKKRNFLRLWLAQLISMTVFFASNYALLILIENITHSTTLVGVSIICFSLPAVIFGPPAGVFVERMNKRRVLWNSNLLRALATFLFVIILLFNRSRLIVPIYLLTFLISTIGQFFAPAEGATIPMLVNQEELMPALSLFSITFMLAQALGFIFLAPLALSFLPTIQLYHFTFDSITQLYMLIGLLYLVCTGLIMLIPVSNFVQPATDKTATEPVTTEFLDTLKTVWVELLQGWHFVYRNKPLYLSVLQLSFAGVLLLVISQLATPIVTQMLFLPANAMAIFFAPAGIGLVSGSVLMPRISRRLGKPRTILMGTIALSMLTLLLPLITLLARSLQPHGWNTNPLLLGAIALVMFLAGFALDCINIPSQTAMQELTPDWIKARVLALQQTFYSAWSIPIIPAIGGIADFFGIDNAIYLLSISELAFGIWGIFYQRKHPLPIPSPDEKEISDQTEPDKVAEKSTQLH
jgi:MFS family permease